MYGIVTTEFLTLVTTKFLSSGMWHCAVWLTKSNILFTKFCSCQNTMTSAFDDTSFAGPCGSTCSKFYLMPWSSISHHIQSNSLPYAYYEILMSFHPQIMCFLFIPHKHFFGPSSGPPSHTDSFEFLFPALTSLYLHHPFSCIVCPEVHPATAHKTWYWIPTARGHPDTVIFMQGTSFLNMSNYILVLTHSGHDWKEVWEQCRFSSCGILYTIHENCYLLYLRVFEVGDWMKSHCIMMYETDTIAAVSCFQGSDFLWSGNCFQTTVSHPRRNNKLHSHYCEEFKSHLIQELIK